MDNRGSLTLESAFVLPIFCLSMLVCLMIFPVMEIQLQLQQAMSYVCNQGSVAAAENLILDSVWYQKAFLEEINSDWLEASWIQSEGGFFFDWVLSSNDCLIFTLEYKVRLPGFAFSLPCKQTYTKRLWNGSSGSKEEKCYVYVTDNNSVYHTYLDCSYLQTNVIGVAYSKLDTYKTAEERAYTPCAVCTSQGHDEVVYITSGGSSWHSTLTCYTLTRSIHRLELQEVEGMPQCSRCLARQQREK